MRLFGKNPVIERLRTNPQSIKNITIQEGFSDAAWVYKKAKQLGIAVYAVPKVRMEKLARNINSQGILVDIDDFKYTPYEDVLEDAVKKRTTLLFLDGLNDPQNLGAIIRSIGCLGHFVIIIPSHEAVGVTETVLRIASGGENHVQICRVSNLNNAIKEAKKNDFQIAGAVVKDGQSIESLTFPYPLGLVVGSEQGGVREIIRKQLDLLVTIPMHIDTMSFNVAHATSILCYEIAKQKHAYNARHKLAQADQ
jgi:23S rRNA (guanosine2251-2'-O)-methyltransferase